MNLAAFYHVWADGAWEAPLAEFCAALEASGFMGATYLGVAGYSRERLARIRALCSRYDLLFWEPEGFESPTLNAVRAYAAENDGVVLYAHTKGASENTPFRARWRRSMTRHVVSEWRRNLAILSPPGRIDVIGCHWLTEAQFPGMFGPMQTHPDGSGFFGGNFWMARCDYLCTLPPCDPEPRWKAETWIGIGKPRVFDLLPGWPHDNRWPELCE